MDHKLQREGYIGRKRQTLVAIAFDRTLHEDDAFPIKMRLR